MPRTAATSDPLVEYLNENKTKNFRENKDYIIFLYILTKLGKAKRFA